MHKVAGIASDLRDNSTSQEKLIVGHSRKIRDLVISERKAAVIDFRNRLIESERSLSGVVAEQGRALDATVSSRHGEFSSLSEDLATKYAESADRLSQQIQRRVVREANLVSRTIRDETQQIESLLWLVQKINPDWMIPQLGNWALDARSAHHLHELVLTKKPETVVELGSGTSTIWLGYIAKQSGAHVYSFEHDKYYLEQTQSMLDAHDLNGHVTLRHAPLEQQIIGDQQFEWYQTAAFDGLPNIDVLLIDGPPGATGPEARYPAVPLLEHLLEADGLVLLDDSVRKEEQDIISRWISEYPNLSEVQKNLSRLAVLLNNRSQ